MYKLDLEKAKESEIKLSTFHWTIEIAREFQENICFIDYTKAFDCVDYNKLWKILKEMGIPGPLTCLLKNLYAGQETTVKMRHGKTGWFQIGKGVLQGYILSPCLFNVYAEYSFPDLEPVCYSMFGSNCCFLTCIQISQEAGQVVWYSHLSKNFPQFVVIHTAKSFAIVNKAEIDVFLELSCFFNDPLGVGNLISGSSAFSKTSLNIRKLMVHVLLKAGLENFEHYFTSL